MTGYIQRGTRQFWRAVAAIFTGSIAAMGAEYCVQPIIPIIAQNFNLTPSVASLVVSCGTGGMAIAMIFIAALANMLDRKWTMSIALAVSAILVVLMAISTNFYLILVLRLLQGLFLAAFPALMIAYISEEFSLNIIGLVTGIYISGNSIGGLLGRVTLSTLTDLYSWRIGLGAIGVLYLIISVCFYFALPKSKQYTRSKHFSPNIIKTFWETLRNKKLVTIYIIGFLVGGGFIVMYNYIAFPLMGPPYNLSQTAIGALFAVYLIGTFSSPFMGGMSDKYGSGKILIVSICIMWAGAVITLLPTLVAKIAGLSVFTFGYFGASPIACSWASKCCTTDKAQGSALYYLFFYGGFSVVGTIGGVFLSAYNWPGVILLISIVLGLSLLLSAKLITSADLFQKAKG